MTILLASIWWMLIGCTVVTVRSSKTPLTKCCSDSQYYVAELDICRKWKGAASPGKMTDAPPVHSLGRGADTNSPGNQSFQMTRSLARCPIGYVGMSTTDFIFYEDGSLSSSTEQAIFQNGTFCIHETYPAGRLIARYCIKDPCKRMASTTCIRKCCPIDMAFDATSKSCKNHTEHFKVALYNQTGYPHTVDINSDHVSDFIVRDGIAPQCRPGYSRKILDRDSYHIRSDGRLFVLPAKCPRSSKEKEVITEDYCIDNVIVANANLTRRAFVCIETNSSCHYEPEASEQEEEAIENEINYYPVFMFISAFFLVATFAVYALIPEIRNIHGVVIMCYVVSRAVAYLVFGTLQLISNRSKVTCRVMSILIHFSYLSTYTWLNAVCFDIWWTLRSMQVSSSINQAIRQNQLGKPFLAYSLYSWGLAAIIVIIGQFLDYYKAYLPKSVIRPGFGEDGVNRCWFSSSNYRSMYAYVYGPVFALIVIDIIFFVTTSVLLHKAGIGSSSRHDREKYRLRVIFGLFVLKIVSWIAEFIAYGTGTLTAAAYAIDIIEALSSVLTFAIFVCKPNIWNLFKQKFPCLERVERYIPYTKNSASRFSNQPTASTVVSSRELLHMDLVKSLSRSKQV